MICANALPIGDNPMLTFGAARCVEEALDGQMANLANWWWIGNGSTQDIHWIAAKLALD